YGCPSAPHPGAPVLPSPRPPARSQRLLPPRCPPRPRAPCGTRLAPSRGRRPAARRSSVPLQRQHHVHGPAVGLAGPGPHRAAESVHPFRHPGEPVPAWPPAARAGRHPVVVALELHPGTTHAHSHASSTFGGVAAHIGEGFTDRK